MQVLSFMVHSSELSYLSLILFALFNMMLLQSSNLLVDSTITRNLVENVRRLLLLV